MCFGVDSFSALFADPEPSVNSHAGANDAFALEELFSAADLECFA